MALNKSITVANRNGKWWVDYYDKDKKRRRESFILKTDADNRKKELELIFSGVIKEAAKVGPALVEPVGEEVVLKDALRRYTDIELTKKKPATQKTEKYMFERLYLFLNNECKRLWLHEVNAEDLSRLQGYLKDEGQMASSVNRKFNAYRDFFSVMKRWGLIAKSPADNLPSLVEEETHRLVWTRAQRNLVFGKLAEWAKDPFHFISYTGCRPGQAAELSWENVDLENGYVRLFSQKGRSIKRVAFPITPELLEFLQKKRTEAKYKFRLRPENKVFYSSKGKPMTVDAFGRAVNKAQKKLIKENLLPEGLVPYGLRHTFMTDLVENGVQARIVQLLAGHAKFETTTRYTSQVGKKSLQDAVLGLEASRRPN